MGRKPCSVLLMCLCSCSLDTSPDLSGANERDAAVSSSSSSPQKRASFRFDAPLQQRAESSLKRGGDDTDAGEPNTRSF